MCRSPSRSSTTSTSCPTGVVVAEGTPDEIRGSREAYVRQFVHGHMDGPVPFRYPSAPYARDLGLGSK